MINAINTIRKMHQHFNILNVPFTPEEKQFRIAAMKEELQEYIDANTVHDELDALLDLIIFAIGTIDRQGLSPIAVECFNRIMHANMQKRVGTNQKRGSFQLDLVKPEGWTAPQFQDLIDKLYDINQPVAKSDIELPTNHQEIIKFIDHWLHHFQTKPNYKIISEMVINLAYKNFNVIEVITDDFLNTSPFAHAAWLVTYQEDLPVTSLFECFEALSSTKDINTKTKILGLINHIVKNIK